MSGRKAPYDWAAWGRRVLSVRWFVSLTTDPLRKYSLETLTMSWRKMVWT